MPQIVQYFVVWFFVLMIVVWFSNYTRSSRNYFLSNYASYASDKYIFKTKEIRDNNLYIVYDIPEEYVIDQTDNMLYKALNSWQMLMKKYLLEDKAWKEWVYYILNEKPSDILDLYLSYLSDKDNYPYKFALMWTWILTDPVAMSDLKDKLLAKCYIWKYMLYWKAETSCVYYK